MKKTRKTLRAVEIGGVGALETLQSAQIDHFGQKERLSMVNFFTPKSGPVTAPSIEAGIEPLKMEISLYFKYLRIKR